MELIAAPFTPFDGQGNIDLRVIPEYFAFLKQEGVNGVFVNGTTGEGFSLTEPERLELADAWLEHRGEQFKVIIHVGSTSIRAAMNMARHAESRKADAIGSTAPFFGPQTPDSVARFLKGLSEAAPQTPLFFYHIPSFTGVKFPVTRFLMDYGESIPTLTGVKFTDENLMDFALARSIERFKMYFGRDEMFSSSLVLGATGAVGSTYNYICPVYRSMARAFYSGDIERVQKLQMAAIRVIQHIPQSPYAIGKAYLKLRGVDCGANRLDALSTPSAKTLHTLSNCLDDALVLAGMSNCEHVESSP